MDGFDCPDAFSKFILLQERSCLRENTENSLPALLLASYSGNLYQLNRLIEQHHKNGRQNHPGCKPCKAGNHNRQSLTAESPHTDVLHQIDNTVKSDKDQACRLESKAQYRSFA